MSPKPFKMLYRVAWVDTDAAQVVHYSNFFRLFERIEEEFYRHLGFTFTEFHNKNIWFPRVEAYCQYKRPAKFNDLLEIELRIDELKEKSVKYRLQITNKENDDLLANGFIVAVAADKQTKKATAIPEEIFEKLRTYQQTI